MNFTSHARQCFCYRFQYRLTVAVVIGDWRVDVMKCFVYVSSN